MAAADESPPPVEVWSAASGAPPILSSVSGPFVPPSFRTTPFSYIRSSTIVWQLERRAPALRVVVPPRVVRQLERALDESWRDDHPLARTANGSGSENSRARG